MYPCSVSLALASASRIQSALSLALQLAAADAVIGSTATAPSATMNIRAFIENDLPVQRQTRATLAANANDCHSQLQPDFSARKCRHPPSRRGRGGRG